MILRLHKSLATMIFIAACASNAQAAPASPAPDATATGSTLTPPVTNPAADPNAGPSVPKSIAHPDARKSAFGGHLPIVDIVPQTDFDDGGGTVSTGGSYPGPVNGSFNLSGSVTIPIASNVSISYDRIAGSFLNSTFGRIATPAGYAQVGSDRRYENQERLDYAVGTTGLTVEGGFDDNEFQCCLGLPFHTGYAALNYATPKIKALNGLSFVLTEKGSTAAHNISATDLAAEADPGLDIRKREYGLTSVLTAVAPIAPSVYFTGTYINGAYDFFVQQPFPYRFNIFNETANFVVNPNVSLQLGAINLTQQRQGSPFGTDNTIRFVNFYTALKVHLDFNKLLAPGKAG